MNAAAAAHFQAFVAEIAKEAARDAVREVLAESRAPLYATAKSNPLGSERRFLDAARRGAFKSHKVGREVRALWADVDAYIQSRPASKRKPKDSDDVDIAALLAQSSGKAARRG